VREFGGIDILVSNAAHQSRKKSLRQVTDREFDRTFKTNIYAYFWLARAALKHMKRGAAIIASSSVTGILGSKELPDYSATKGAINAFTKTLAMQLIDRGIRVNAVAPGPVWTPLNPSDPGLSAEGGRRVRQRPSDGPARPAGRACARPMCFSRRTPILPTSRARSWRSWAGERPAGEPLSQSWRSTAAGSFLLRHGEPAAARVLAKPELDQADFRSARIRLSVRVTVIIGSTTICARCCSRSSIFRLYSSSCSKIGRCIRRGD
jgi:hypothetical protein